MCCMICVEWELGRLTASEARRNAVEYIWIENDDREKQDHLFDLLERIETKLGEECDEQQ